MRAVGILHEPVAPARVDEEEQEAEVHPGHGGLVAGKHERPRVVLDRQRGEEVGVGLVGADHVGDDVVAEVPALGLDDAAHVLLELRHRLERVHAAGVHAHAVGETEHVVAVLFRHAEERADHEDGELVAEQVVVVDGLCGVAVVRDLHVVEATVGLLLDPPLEETGPLGSEAGCHQSSEPDRLGLEVDTAHRRGMEHGVGHARRVRGVVVHVVTEPRVRERDLRLLVGDDEPRGIPTGVVTGTTGVCSRKRPYVGDIRSTLSRSNGICRVVSGCVASSVLVIAAFRKLVPHESPF